MKCRAKKVAAWVCCGALIAALAAFCGCAPSAQSSTSSDKAGDAQKATTEQVSDMSFLNKDSGALFEDNHTNTELLNTGHRGCNSCHPDLADKMGDPDRPALHAVVKAGYGKALTIKDCGSCHGFAGGFYAPNLSDIIHGSHYSNATFVDEYDGNCWSCHSTKQVNGQWEMVLWEDVMYEPTLGGYADAVTNPKAREWVRDHGHGSDYLNGTRTEANPDVDVEFNQDVTSLDDKFIVYNYPPDNLDMDKITDPNNTVTLKGVVNEKSFTVDDLKSLPQTTKVYGHACTTNGQGGDLVGNFEYTGVLIKDLVDACGGLIDGNNMATLLCYDNWRFANNALPADLYLNGMIAYEMNGEPLNADNGAPMMLCLPGMPAGCWGKYIEEITFQHSDNPGNIIAKVAAAEKYQGLANYINSGWFQNDGVEVNLGEKVELSGWAWGWTATSPEVSKVSFSTDGGVTWVEKDIPADHDPDCLSQFTFSWTPKEAGYYVVKVNAENAAGQAQYSTSSIIVKVNA